MNMKTHIITTAIIRNKDKYLIGKRAATKEFSPNQWEFITGFMDAQESPEETIIREIKEELGAKGRIISKSNIFDFIDNEGKWFVTPFLVELDTKKIQANQGDHSELRWVMASDLKSYGDLKLFLNNEGIQKWLGLNDFS